MVIRNGKEGEFVDRPDGTRVFRPAMIITNVLSPTLQVQMKVLELLELPPRSSQGRTLLETHGGEIRDVLDTYEIGTGKPPTAHDIVWCVGMNSGINLRVEATLLKRAA